MQFHLPIPSHTETRFIRLDTDRCQACWACIPVCPQHVIGKVDLRFHRHAKIAQPENCRGCLRCFKACMNQAILVRKKTHGDDSK